MDGMRRIGRRGGRLFFLLFGFLLWAQPTCTNGGDSDGDGILDEEDPCPYDRKNRCLVGERCEGVSPLPGVPLLALEEVGVFDQPLDLAAPAGDLKRVFVVERRGVIRIVQEGMTLSTPFLDISWKVSSGGERGLFSIAFHPDYWNNGKFYLSYTDRSGTSTISEFRVSSNPNVADRESERVLLTQEQPYANHNGGQIAFDGEGFLFIAFGDGGSGGDPLENGQNLETWLGAILRISVDGGEPYEVPAGNPFVGLPPARPEIWAYGLRNPWRFSFDSATNGLYIADVGQNAWEEINLGRAEGGENYGWNVMEGNHCFDSETCDPTGLTPPILEYGHDEGCSITGGHVYRGCLMPGHHGKYFYADYCSGFVRSFRYDEGVTDVESWSEVFGPIASPVAFGRDAAGELYILSQRGEIFKIVPQQEDR